LGVKVFSKDGDLWGESFLTYQKLGFFSC